MIYGPFNEIWRTRYSNGLYMPYDELDIVKVIKIGILSGWDSSLECKNWILDESLLFLNQETLDLWGNLS